MENIIYNLEGIKKGYIKAVKDGHKFNTISSLEGMLFEGFIINVFQNGSSDFIKDFIDELNFCFNY